MKEPFVGLPATGSGCGFGGMDLDSTDGCDAEPAKHYLAESPGWGHVSLATCAVHDGIARASAIVLDQHAYGPACEGGSCWTTDNAEEATA